jgi:hypothetical protein
VVGYSGGSEKEYGRESVFLERTGKKRDFFEGGSLCCSEASPSCLPGKGRVTIADGLQPVVRQPTNRDHEAKNHHTQASRLRSWLVFFAHFFGQQKIESGILIEQRGGAVFVFVMIHLKIGSFLFVRRYRNHSS